MITEWLSFWIEFIPSPYISLHLFAWYQKTISFPYKSFWFSFRIKSSFWYKFWYHVNWKRTLFWILNRKSYSLARVANTYLTGAKTTRVRSLESNTNLTLEQNSFQNESHSGIIQTDPNSLLRVHSVQHWAKKLPPPHRTFKIILSPPTSKWYAPACNWSLDNRL